jgi:serralysin
MSYFGGSATGESPGLFATAETPMMFDIYELQKLYGANNNTRTGDTVYGFGSNAGSIYSFSVNTAPQLCIWDAGGADRLDCSGYGQSEVINLNQGTFSNIGGQIANVSIALGVTIETAIGGSGNDTIIGNSAANTLTGGVGNDTITGGGGNDAIDGGSGTDTAVYSGLRSQYQITTNSNGFHIADLRPGVPDGADDVSNVERFQFAVEVDGSTRLTVVGDLSGIGSRFFLYDRNGSGPSLKYFGMDALSGQFGGWAPIGAEQTATGYDVAWKSGADAYTIWSTDSSGNYITNLIGAVSGASFTLQSFEPILNQDLNGDGLIGLPTTVIEANGSTRLTQVGVHFFLYDSSGSGPSLKQFGIDALAGQFGGWAPIGAERTASGYDVAWKSGADSYTVWSTDSSGNYITNLIGAVSGASFELQSFEPIFNQDLNGNGSIGPPTTVIEASGSTRLTQVGNHFFLYDSSGSGPSLKQFGMDAPAGQFGGWAPIGAERTASGYDVAWKSGADSYTVWSTDSSGNYIANLIGAVPGASFTLQSFEPIFNQDLNGDGLIGSPTTVIEANGSTRLTQVGNHFFLYDSSGLGPSLKQFGMDALVGQFGGWAPIGAERTASGYDVAWKSGADGYTVWSTDSSGNYITNLIGSVSGASFTLQSFEPVFHQDLNGDGLIGPPGASKIGEVDLPPAVTVPNSSVPATAGQVFQVSSLFSASDADNDTLTFMFYDSTPGNGHFALNGVVQQDGDDKTFAVSASDLSNLTFVAGATGSDSLGIGANDGHSFSGWTTLTINGPPHAPPAPDGLWHQLG